MKNKKKIICIITSVLILLFVMIWVKEKIIQDQKEQVVFKYQEVINNTNSKENIIKKYQSEFNNSDIVGELSIENTSLKIPIPASQDNNYYLDHLLNREKNKLGSAFLDYRNNVSDRKIIIYGHNSRKIHTEFKDLEEYLNEDYYENHKIINFRTQNDLYKYVIFSIYIATDDYQHVNLKFDDKSYSEHLNWLKNESVYDTRVLVNGNDDIIVLQTCFYNPLNSYLIVVGKKI